MLLGVQWVSIKSENTFSVILMDSSLDAVKMAC